MKQSSKSIASSAKKLRILFVSEYFYPRAAGGEVWSWELCTALADLGHRVTVITCRHDDSPQDEKINGVHILRPVNTTANEQERFTRQIQTKKLLKHVAAHVERNKKNIDVIHTMAYAVNVDVSKIAKKYHIPSITSVHSYFGKDWKNMSALPSILRWQEKKRIRDDQSTIMQVPSKYLQTRIREDVGKETVVIHNWLPEKFPQAKKLKKGTLLFVGSLEAVKNPLACVDVAKSLHAPLIVIGKGSLEIKLQEQAKKAHIRCTIINTATHSQTLSYIGGASMVLIPSITESFSLVAIEAAAQGTPVSGTPVGILPELPGYTEWPPKKIPSRISKTTAKKITMKYSRETAMIELLNVYNIMHKNVTKNYVFKK